MNHPRLTSVSSGSMSLQHWILNGHLGWNLQPVMTTSVPGTDPGMLCKVNWPARGIVRYNAFEYGWPCPERTFSAGPNSTVCPAYNTAILCAIFSAIARLCVMSNNPILVCSTIDSSSPRTSACMVTSRAVVGSSAIYNCGFDAIAIAMATRCFNPPDN